MSKSTGYPADDKPPEGTCSQDWSGSLCNDGVGKTQQDADEQSDRPAGPRQTDIWNYESYGEPSDERPEHGYPLVGETHGDHERNINAAEDQTTKYAQRDSRHRTHPSVMVATLYHMCLSLQPGIWIQLAPFYLASSLWQGAK